MVQRKLKYYLQRPVEPELSTLSSSAPSFLNLPHPIRYRIYALVGLIRFCPINFNQEGDRASCVRASYSRGTDSSQSSDYACFYESKRFMGEAYKLDCRPACNCPPLPISLLCVSRAISQEVLNILYSENSFTICRSDARGWGPLKTLNTSALLCFHKLTIRLNRCDCLYNGAFQHWKESQDAKLIGLYSCHPLCQQYDAHDRPLRSSPRQDAAALQDWQDIVRRLATFCMLESLRLDIVCDTQDMETAHHVINQLSIIPQLRACSIRLSVDSNPQYSALARQAVRRLADRQQIPDYKPMNYHLPLEIISHILQYSELVAPFDLEWRPDRGLVPFDCCRACTATLDCCTCAFYHGAHSSSCTCWRLPLSIFLTSRQVYQCAREIFYQRNRFIILPEGGRLSNLWTCKAALPAFAKLLQRLPPNTAPLFRSIGLAVLLPELAQFSSVQHLLLTQWRSIIRLLSASCDVQKLRLALFIGESLSHPISQPPYRALTDHPELRDLQDFFVYIQWPIHASGEGVVRYSAELEREVLGSAYDSSAKGKWTELPRLWYDGMSREGSIFAADGSRIWPRQYPMEDAYGPPSPRPYTYA
ncbi:hypothetical protein F4808DRAFT_354860 [Astrocystis sublimbata]|nr:hypothetical protein F4808DRAFT_70940 [Astrocystis sublimbata]KAI0193897.1 hypothetical protein F4808DRAFT_354860 [Astrocystis sublimbata]